MISFHLYQTVQISVSLAHNSARSSATHCLHDFLGRSGGRQPGISILTAFLIIHRPSLHASKPPQSIHSRCYTQVSTEHCITSQNTIMHPSNKTALPTTPQPEQHGTAKQCTRAQHNTASPSITHFSSAHQTTFQHKTAQYKIGATAQTKV